MLILKELCKTYETGSKQEVLKNLNVEFDSTGFVSILGPSGSGKTTLLNIIGGLDSPTSGEVIIDEMSTKSFTNNQFDYYRSNVIGFVFQNYNLINQLNVFENVKLGLELSSISNDKASDLVIDSLKRVHLETEMYSLPTCISGGQQQRVAIARALVKKPKVLLCDEPTGALDSKTSEEILELLKEFSKECLIIMVTHNEELAFKYSSRIIRMNDGEIVDDSVKSTPSIESVPIKLSTSKMSLRTSLKIGVNNLLRKKKKTLLTSFGCSVGIIGISLILGITDGFNNYLKKMETDALSKYPLTITEDALDVSSILELLSGPNEEGEGNGSTNSVKFPTDSKIFLTHLEEIVSDYQQTNDITFEYIDYLKNMDSSWYNDIVVRTDQNISRNVYSSFEYHNEYGSLDDFVKYSSHLDGLDLNINGTAYFSMMPQNQEFVLSQYDCIGGRMPTNKNEMLVVVDQYNQINDLTIALLGLSDYLFPEDYHFNEILGLKYSLVLNQDKYIKISDGVYETNKNIKLSEDLEIVGILRPNKETQFPMLKSGIVYTKELYDYILDQNFQSDICKDIRNEIKLTIDGDSNIDEDFLLREIGATKKPYSVRIYPTNDLAKIEIEKYLDEYNDNQPASQRILYIDAMAVLTETISSLISKVSYVLIGFVCLSLVVSSIMIGITTYSSILERTKEIGILRSLGARRKDVSRMFNIETSVLGFISGVFGIVVCAIVGVIVNVIISTSFGISGLFNFKWYYAIVLIAISVLLSFISGAIPSNVLSRKKPVECIRGD